MPNPAASALLALALAVSPAAVAQVLYKWTDAQGNTHYGDKPPKGFKGTVTRIETDAFPPPVPAAAPASRPPPRAEEEPPPQDMNARRRANRLQLEAKVRQAREDLEAARKARAEGEEAAQDERQVVQRLRASDATGKNTARINCRQVPGKDGKPVTMCPTIVPGEAYYDRLERLDEAVREAEAALAAAQRDYRRGVD